VSLLSISSDHYSSDHSSSALTEPANEATFEMIKEAKEGRDYLRFVASTRMTRALWWLQSETEFEEVMDDHSRDEAREEERMEEEEQQNEEPNDGEEIIEEEDNTEDDDREPDAEEPRGWAPDIRRYALSSNWFVGSWWIPWPSIGP
jgi:hypothetical protein